MHATVDNGIEELAAVRSDPPELAGGAASALPVTLQLGGRNADAVRRWVEGVLGWQSTDPSTVSLLPPVVELRDLAAGTSDTSGRVPVVLLVDDDAAPVAVARAGGVIATADAVVGWPSGRDELADVVGDVLARPRVVDGRCRVLRIGGSAGGVGTTTVALALAGISGWSGVRTLAAVRAAWSPLRVVPAAALASPDVWSQADQLPGLSSARAVRITDMAQAPEPTDPSIEVAIFDVGVDGDVDVIVCRPDAAALAILPTTTAAAVVVVGDGPARPADLQRAADGRRAVHLPWSTRVARAGFTGRVPAGLPGAWLRRLTPLAPGRVRSAP